MSISLFFINSIIFFLSFKNYFLEGMALFLNTSRFSKGVSLMSLEKVRFFKKAFNS